MQPATAVRLEPELELAQSPSPLRDTAGWLSVATATAAGEALRFWYVLQVHPPAGYLHSDMLENVLRAYAMLGQRPGGGPLSVYVPRGISALCAIALWLFPDRSVEALSPIQALLGATAVPLLFVSVRRFWGRRPALLAAWLWALDFLPIGYLGFFLAENFLAFLLVLALALLRPARPGPCLAAGLALGLACTFKGYTLLLVVLWGGALLVARRRWSAAALLCGTLAVVVPESIAVSRIAGRPALLSTNGGQIFYSGHCPVHLLTCHGSQGTWVAGAPTTYALHPDWPDVQLDVPCYDSAAYYRMGWLCLRQMGWSAVPWAAEQVAAAFAGWPGHTLDPWPVDEGGPGAPLGHLFNLATAYLVAPLALWALWRRRRSLGAWLATGLPLAAVLAVALIFMGDPRYREPFDAFLVGGAAAGGLDVWEAVGSLARRGVLW